MKTRVLLLSLFSSILLMLVALIPATTAQAASYSREDRAKRAQTVLNMSFPSWERLAARYASQPPRSGLDATLDWSAVAASSDGCSVPSWMRKEPAVETYAGVFRSACERHDFGYRNFGKNYYTKNLALIPSNDQKAAVDDRFKQDMLAICARSNGGFQCRRAAGLFYKGVRNWRAEVAWHNRECLPDKLCLYANDNYEGQRWMFSQSHMNLDDFGFGDEADSAKVTTRTVWWVYSDPNMGGDAGCMAPKLQEPNLDSAPPGWGDKIHSILRSGGATRCS